MKTSVRHILPVVPVVLLVLLSTVLASPLPAQERTVIRHAPPEDGGGLVLEQAPPSVERRRALEDWHRRYVRRAGPLRREARALLHVPDRSRDLGPDCHELGRNLLELGDEELQNAPHFAVRRHVDTGFLRLGRAVAWCLSGRLTRAHLQWVEAEKAFGAADRLLMRLGL